MWAQCPSCFKTLLVIFLSLVIGVVILELSSQLCPPPCAGLIGCLMPTMASNGPQVVEWAESRSMTSTLKHHVLEGISTQQKYTIFVRSWQSSSFWVRVALLNLVSVFLDLPLQVVNMVMGLMTLMMQVVNSNWDPVNLWPCNSVVKGPTIRRNWSFALIKLEQLF